MASNRMINIQKAISDIDAKMGKLSHRRTELEAQLSRLSNDHNSTLGTTSHCTEPSATGAEATSASEFTSPVANVDEHYGDLGTLSATEAFMAVATLVGMWDLSDNQVCEALQTLDCAWDLRHVAQTDHLVWMRNHASEVQALANAYGFNAHWLKRLS